MQVSYFHVAADVPDAIGSLDGPDAAVGEQVRQADRNQFTGHGSQRLE